MRIAICVKQVPATADVQIDRVTKRLKRENNAVEMNACDCYAMELALRLREKYGASVTAFTMGPPQARAVLKSCRALGAESGYILNDMAFAGSDTYATAHILSCAIKADETENGPFDLILCGRQSSDGDTAQVGPQVAQKLDLNQVTYVTSVDEVKDGKVVVTRHIDGGIERVEAPMPILLTVNGNAAPCRPRNAKLVMKYKRASAPMERPAEGLPYAEEYDKKPYLTIAQWSVFYVDGDLAQCGLAGSPTKVKAVQNIVFKAKESKVLTASDADVEGLIQELLANHTIG